MGRVDLPPKRDRLGTATRIPDLGGDWAECARGVRRVKIVQADPSERPWTRALVARAVPNVSTGQDRRVPGDPAEPKVFRPTDASTAADESLCGVRVFAFHVTAQGYLRRERKRARLRASDRENGYLVDPASSICSSQRLSHARLSTNRM